LLLKAVLAGMAVDPESNTPILILKSEDTNQAIPIWIGLLEATSIASVIKSIEFDRPMTHDLFKNFMGMLDFFISKVEICDIKNNTYFAKIYFASKEKNFFLDARPSDAIAIALRFKAPIYVDEKVIAKSMIDEKEVEVSDKSKEGQKWAEYLDNLSPDDFIKT